MISLMRLIETTYDYGCVMACIDDNTSKKILDFNNEIISKDILYTEDGDNTFGREKDPHITIKYGLTKSYTEEQIKKFLDGVSPFDIQIKGIGIFENDKFDVIKFNVESSTLRKLNKIFSDLPNHDEYPTYNPHMTLAYVKKGMGKKFSKSSDKIAKIPIQSVVYSDKGKKSYIDL